MSKAESAPARWWECPCGTEPPKRGGGAIPVRTLVSLREPRCGFCGRPYKREYERGIGERHDEDEEPPAT